jgi:hypothetical protein
MRITDFPELFAPTGNDLLVTVDIANDLTKKVKLDNLPISLPALTALATKQDSLVSGVTIKTVNSQSLLGAGDIPIPIVTPSGVSGAIQFSNGSAFASDADNFFWDDTNNRLGVGTNAPQSKTEINSTGNQLLLSNSGDIYTYLKFSAQGGFASMIFGDGGGGVNYLNNYSTGMWASNKFAFGPSLFAPSAQVHIKGSGSTSATTSLLVQNSAGTDLLRVRDDGQTIARTFTQNAGDFSTIISGTNFSIYTAGGTIQYNGNSQFMNNLSVNGQLSMSSTTQGFLPPRMTTTQKNAIASPAAGLVVYDSTTNKLCCYNGSTWNDLF